MALNVKNIAVERLVAEVARLPGEPKTEAVRRALEERKARLACLVVGADRVSRLRRCSAWIENAGYRSPNYWGISAGRSRLLVDFGWPGTMGLMRANLKRMDVSLNEIRYALTTQSTTQAWARSSRTKASSSSCSTSRRRPSRR